MARGNFPFLAFNRGLVSRRAIARVDLDRTRLSAEEFTNWVPDTQGAMGIRPGTKYVGSSLRDTGAAWIEFVASTDDVALLELTPEKMRIFIGDDAHNLQLLGRPPVNTTLTLTDTGWSDTSIGGASFSAATDVIPTMTSQTTSGVQVISSEESINYPGWLACDDDTQSLWETFAFPSWLSVDFGSGVTRAIASYAVQASPYPGANDYMPRSWRLLSSPHDTGTFNTDTGKWTLQDERTGQTGWSVSEKRTFNLNDADTGTLESVRCWRFYATANAINNSFGLSVGEFELFTDSTNAQVSSQGGGRRFNAAAIGSLARLEKRVRVSDTGTEHSLAIHISHGPMTLRVGSSQRDDDYVSETSLGTGYHNLAFTPQGDFYVTLQTDSTTNKLVASCQIGDSGTVEITTPWAEDNLDDIRFDQSADVVYVDCAGIIPQKIERRGTGRSWSVVEYFPENGPFLPTRSSSAKLSVNNFTGDVSLKSDIPYFTADHVGAIFRLFHNGQSGLFFLGNLEATTDAIEVTGIGDTGTAGTTNERRVTFTVTGSYTGRIIIERSYDGADIGFKTASPDYGASATGDTGTFTRNIDDEDDNRKIWYRARMSSWSTGCAEVRITYGGGGVTGVCRVTSFNSNMNVSAAVIKRFSDTGPTDNWQEGFWSDVLGYPTAVALHGGRLSHARGGSVFLSASDDYENFDQEEEGDGAPIIRTLGSGPVDNIYYLAGLLRLIIGTAGAEIMMKSSSLDEPLTPDNAAAVTFSTQGSANLRPVKMDNRIIHVQRSGQRVFMIGAGTQGTTFGDYESTELTLFVPDLLTAGVVSIACQRQPDTRIHCVLADGTVQIMTYEPQEETLCWYTWRGDTGTGAAVEKAVVLPGREEDAVYYHIRRTINGQTKRYLEKVALRSETVGDTGLTWLMDCARSYTDTGRTNNIRDVATHLVGESVVAWGSLDTGSTPHVDLSPDVNGVQTRYTVDTGGDITLSLTEGVHHCVVGLPYRADWQSAKLAFAAEAGTALAQMKRMAQVGLLIAETHNNGLWFGNDTGNLSPLPRIIAGERIDQDQIFDSLDMIAVPVPSGYTPDARLHLRAKSPRPATILAAVPGVQTNERV